MCSMCTNLHLRTNLSRLFKANGANKGEKGENVKKERHADKG